MHGESGMVQLEFHPVVRSDSSIAQIMKESAERSFHFGRSKIVLSFPISRHDFRSNVWTKKGKEGAKKYLVSMLLDCLSDSASQKVLIERSPGDPFDFLQENEYHGVEESIGRLQAENTWVFIFDNSKEDMINTGKLKMVYSHM